MRCRAADGHAVDAELRQTPQEYHHQHGGQSAQHGEQHGRQVSGKQSAQQTAGQQNGQRRAGTQLIQGEHSDDVGKAQLHAGKGHQQGDGEQPLQGTEPQRQRCQHGAEGDVFCHLGRQAHDGLPGAGDGPGVDAVLGGTVAVGHGDGAALGGNVQRIAAAGDGGLGEVGQGDTADLLTGDVDDHGEGAALVFGQIEAQRGDDGQQHDRQRHQRVKAVPFQFRRRGVGRHRRFRPFR